MLVNQFGRQLPDSAAGKTIPMTGIMIEREPMDRMDRDVSRGLTPALVDRVLTEANNGYTCEQSRLAMEILEKNWDIFQVMQTRRLAVQACKWHIEPGGDQARDKEAADEYEAMLKETGNQEGLRTFKQTIYDQTSAIMPGFAVSEIIWKPGGDIVGFQFIEQKNFTLMNSLQPMLVTRDNLAGMPLIPNKFVVTSYWGISGDPARGGLIRPLAWLHCFQNIGYKDLLNFVERFGMPFIVAKVDKNTWDNERNVLHALIRNFGPNGGGVFTKSTDLELVQTAGTTAGDIYFKLLDNFANAIEKVVLGQTATSGEASGWSKGDAQSKVRQDILNADCEAIMDSLNSRIAAPWTLFKYGQDTAAPRLVIDYDPPADEKAEAETGKVCAETVQVLVTAGYDLDDNEVSEKTGFTVKKKVRATDGEVVTAGGQNGAIPQSVLLAAAARAKTNTIALSADPTDAAGPAVLRTWLGPLADTIIELIGDESGDAEFKSKLAALASPDTLQNLNSDALANVLVRQAAQTMKQTVESQKKG